jgi:sugar phosphate isomerase/epimerase
MKRIQGPAIFLAQFLGHEPPFNTLAGICRWAADLGYKGVQLPAWDSRIIDLEQCAKDQTYADNLKAQIAAFGLEITELSTHLQGQLVAVHPVYDTLFDGFAPAHLRGRPAERTAWATQQLLWAAQASKRLQLTAHVTFSGALLWPFVYPWPQRPPGLTQTGFGELAARWLPILDVFDAHGVDLCYELHPGEDLHDGTSFDQFLEAVSQHPRACINYDPSHFMLQQLDYLGFIDHYHSRIKAFHVKDAEFNPTAKQGVYGGYTGWQDRAGRFRSLGDGQVDFKGIFSRLAQYGYSGWAVLEWECCIKSPAQGAAEGAPFIAAHLIDVTEKAFDDFAGTQTSEESNKKLLGL